jgi:hypothetical protein
MRGTSQVPCSPDSGIFPAKLPTKRYRSGLAKGDRLNLLKALRNQVVLVFRTRM